MPRLPLLALACALALALALTPLVRGAALRSGALDAPDGRLKLQAKPVPTLGGLAIYFAFALALLVAAPWGPVPLVLLGGGGLLVAAGCLDDLGRLPLAGKLGAQSAAALLALLAADLRIHFVPFESVPGLAFALSFLWLVGVSNALNFLDVMDGLAAGTAFVAASALALAGLVAGDAVLAAAGGALAGACLGFLVHNRPPARIYMGDAGSLLLGFALAALALRGRYTERSAWGVLAPLLILGVPVLEVAFVSLMRWRKGISPLRGSPDHVACRLRASGLPVPRVLALLWSAAALSAAAGLALQLAAPGVAPWIVLVWSLAALCACLPLARIAVPARAPFHAESRT
jgi:UDP-GlcNAc:undecaprenyl-phosphate GlcNAc-1-phosphate transferase